MTRPFEFLDFKKYNVHEYFGPEYFLSDGTPKPDWIPPESAGDYEFARTYSYGLSYEFCDYNSISFQKPFIVTIRLDGKGKFYTSSDPKRDVVQATNCGYTKNATGEFITKKYKFNGYEFCNNIFSKMGFTWSYNDNSEVARRLVANKIYTYWDFGRNSVSIAECSNKKGRTNNVHLTVIQNKVYDVHVHNETRCLLSYDRDSRICFEIRDDEHGTFNCFLANMPNICPTFLWNDTMMFEANLMMSSELSERFEQIKKEIEKVLDESIGTGYYVPHAKGLRHLIDVEKGK